MSANVAFSRALSGLSQGTAYQLHFVAGNAGGYSAVWSAPFTTTAVAPTLAAAARSITDIGTTSVTFAATSNVPATAWWVIRPAADPIPTAVQIAAAADRSSGTMSANVAFVRTHSGLTPGTAYRLHLTAQNGNLYSAVWTAAFTTVDTPTLSAMSITAITSTGATLNARSNFAATAYWVLRPVGEPAPSADQIVAEAGANTGAMVGGTAFSRGLTGLSPGTAYQLHFVAGNAGGYSAVWSAVFTTTAVAPTLAAAARSITDIGTTSVTFTATSNVVATGYWTVRLASQAVPTAAQIVAEAGSNTGAMSAGVPFIRTQTDLTPGTAYRLHFVARNGNLYSAVWTAAFTTAR
jgi:hypothetical protein